MVIWNVSDLQLIREFVPKKVVPVTALAWRSDGTRLAAAIGSYTVAEFSPDFGTQFETSNDHPIAITSIDYSPGDRFLASASRDFDYDRPNEAPTIIVTDLQGIKPTTTFRREFSNGHALALDFSPDGRWLASGTTAGQVEIATLASETEPGIFRPGRRTLTSHNAGIIATAFSPVGGLLATGDRLGGIALWRGADGVLLHRLGGTPDGVNDLDFTRDGRTVASAGIDGTIRIWNVADGRLQRTIIASSEWSISSIAFSPDGRQILGATGFGDPVIAIWDTSSPDPLRRFEGQSGPITAVAWGGDGQQVISASEDGSIAVWKSATGEKDFSLAENELPWLSLDLSGDGTTLAAGNLDGSIHFWSMPSGDPLAEISGIGEPVTSLDISRNGALVASTGYDNRVRLWEVASRRELHRYAGDPIRHSTVAIDADSGRVASGSYDGTAVVWRLVTTSSSAPVADAIATPATASPNPFAGQLAIVVTLPVAGTVDGGLYNLRGESVAGIKAGWLPAGTHRIEIDTEQLPPGAYCYRLITPAGTVNAVVVRGE